MLYYFQDIMLKPIYINGTGLISIQPTFEAEYRFEYIQRYEGVNTIPAMDPEYKTLIPPLQLRRMNRSMRMALFATKLALAEAGAETVDAVITGTGLGCLKDSEKFVEQVLEREGEVLNPTPFIQSTHNMAAATLALALGCKGYNMTYTNNANSLESALLDGMLYLTEHPERQLLLGGVDELGGRSTEFWKLAGYLKTEQPGIPTPTLDAGIGEIASEGAAFFVATASPTKATRARLSAVRFQLNVDDISTFVNEFLTDNGWTTTDIDALILGVNGDSRYDEDYQSVGEMLFAKTPQVAYKTILGEHDTIVGAAIVLATQLLGKSEIPTALQHNKVAPRLIKRILIYNHRRGQHHSLIVLDNEF